MRITKLIESHFWFVLLAGIILGLWAPVEINAPPVVPKLLLGMMLFTAFMKIDALDIIESLKNFRLISWITFVYMLAIPLVFISLHCYLTGSSPLQCYCSPLCPRVLQLPC
ncbi:MAG: hypothetical protein IPI69_00765 [Bacteroidales bacterium]|nr:hypothetical protein [Bacteroidales bacterium]